MPKYETNQQLVGYIRRLAGEFQGFNSQSVAMSGEMVQMLQGQITYRTYRTFVALFTKPGTKQDTLVLSLPFLRLSDKSPESLLQKLLEWNNGATESVHFAIDELLNTVNIVCVRPADTLVYAEFSACMDNMVAVRTNASRSLQSQFGGTGEIRELQ